MTSSPETAKRPDGNILASVSFTPEVEAVRDRLSASSAIDPALAALDAFVQDFESRSIPLDDMFAASAGGIAAATVVEAILNEAPEPVLAGPDLQPRPAQDDTEVAYLDPEPGHAPQMDDTPPFDMADEAGDEDYDPVQAARDFEPVDPAQMPEGSAELPYDFETGTDEDAIALPEDSADGLFFDRSEALMAAGVTTTDEADDASDRTDGRWQDELPDLTDADTADWPGLPADVEVDAQAAEPVDDLWNDTAFEDEFADHWDDEPDEPARDDATGPEVIGAALGAGAALASASAAAPGAQGVAADQPPGSAPAAPKSRKPLLLTAAMGVGLAAVMGAGLFVMSTAPSDAPAVSDRITEVVVPPTRRDAPPDPEAALRMERLAQGLKDALEAPAPRPAGEATPMELPAYLGEAEIAAMARRADLDAVRGSMVEMAEAMGALARQLSQQAEAATARDARIDAAAARAASAESIALAQNELAVEIVRLQEKMMTAEALIVDLSQRLAGLEAVDPADRTVVERTLEDLNRRMTSLGRDVNLVARLAVNGTTTAPRPGAASPPGGAAVYDGTREARPAGVQDPSKIPGAVKAGDFVPSYGHVLDIMQTESGRLVIMENGSAIIR